MAPRGLYATRPENRNGINETSMNAARGEKLSLFNGCCCNQQAKHARFSILYFQVAASLPALACARTDGFTRVGDLCTEFALAGH